VEPFCFAGGGSLKFDVSEFSLTNMDGKAVQPTKVGMIVRKVLLRMSKHISFPKALVQEYLMLHTQGRRRRYALCHHKRRGQRWRSLPHLQHTARQEILRIEPLYGPLPAAFQS
jgi:hypothetical protein